MIKNQTIDLSRTTAQETIPRFPGGARGAKLDELRVYQQSERIHAVNPKSGSELILPSKLGDQLLRGVIGELERSAFLGLSGGLDRLRGAIDKLRWSPERVRT
jgi:hypothetical protein